MHREGLGASPRVWQAPFLFREVTALIVSPSPMIKQQVSKCRPLSCRYTIEPAVAYLVKIDGLTKLVTTDYNVAIAYVCNARAQMGWGNPDARRRIRMTMDWKK